MAPPNLRRARGRAALAAVAALAVLAAVALATGCAQMGGSRGRLPLPPVPERSTPALPGKFVWMDLITDEPDLATRFYGELFGWEFEQGEGFVSVLLQGEPIAGIVVLDPDRGDGSGSAWVGSLSVPDVAGAAAQIRESGGSVIAGPRNAPARGELALVSDPAGARFVVFRAKGGDPPDDVPSVGEFLWRELWTSDAGEARAFYGLLAPYSDRAVDFRGESYTVLETMGRPRAGVMKSPIPEVKPQWLPYVRVANAKETAARARRLGAEIVAEDDDAAILLDPSGTPIGIQRWERGMLQ